MMMIVPPECQGQTVESSYGWHEGSLYRRTEDRSDGSVWWARADSEESDALPEGWIAVNGAPPCIGWEPCRDPEPVPSASDERS